MKVSSGSFWYEHSIDDAFDGARSAVAADLDNDGDIDVAAAADEADDVTWWENLNGLGTDWGGMNIQNFNGTAMEEAEINSLVDRLFVFHDDNDNRVLEVGVDPLLAVDSTITMVSPGYVQLSVPHSQINPGIGSDDSESFFLVAQIEEGAASASPSCFRAVHKAGGTVTALQYDLYDIDPTSALFFAVDGGLVCAGNGIFSDGFESGNTSAWSNSLD